MADELKKASYLKATTEEASDAKSWRLPVMKDENHAKDDSYTNVIKKPRGWVYEPPEPEPEVPQLPTLEEIEEIRKAAYEEGFQQGKDAGLKLGHEEGLEQGVLDGLEDGQEIGLADGLEQGQGLIEEKADVWNQLISQLEQPLRHIDQQVENELVELAMQLAKAVIKTEVLTNNAVLLKTVKDAMSALPAKATDYELHLHPDDLAEITAVYGEEGIEKRQWRLLDEPALQRGDCEVKADTSSVTYTLEQRIAETLDSFLQDNTSET